MKGDFSRQTFDPRRHYDGVLMQQGRVQVDADWNEADAISRYRDELAVLDTIGRCGGPLHAAGFEITTDGQQLFIGRGRYWVDGILVENDQGLLDYDSPALKTPPLAFAAQPFFPGGALAEFLAQMQEQGAEAAVVYLDVWQRHVTALEDPRLREVALGGPDTTTRVQTVWQVKLLPLGSGNDGDRRGLLERRKSLQADRDGLKEAIDKLTAEIADLQKQIDALPADSGLRKELQAQQAELATEQKDLDTKASELDAALAEVDKALAALGEGILTACDGQIAGWDALNRQPGLLNARAEAGDPSDDPCDLPPGGGYTRLENQLYRVEIHRGGDLGSATFKWSRDNGTVVAAIEQISGSTVRVDSLGPDDVLGFASGQWVELLDDRVELAGASGQLALITAINTATRELTLDPAPQPLDTAADGIDPTLHPRLRRWDQASATATADGVLTAAGWLDLEDGVQVQFSQPAGTTFRPGDYWTIPARTATAEVEWPPYETPNLQPQPQPPAGVRHHFCRLAIVGWDRETWRVLDDCRQLFPPLTELCCGRPALHVAAINWDNDGVVNTAQLIQPGLRITLDAPPDPASVSNDSVLVTYDFPYRSGDTVIPNARERIVLLGNVGVDPKDDRTIVWQFQAMEGRRPNVDGLAAGGPGAAQPQGPDAAAGGAGAPGAGDVAAPGDAGPNAGGSSAGVDILRPPLLGGMLVAGPLVERATAPARTAIRLNVTLRGNFIWRREQRKRIYLDGQALGAPAVDRRTGVARTDLDLPSGDGRRASDFESWFYVGGEQPRPANPLQVTTVTFRSTFTRVPKDVLVVKEFTTDPAKFVTFPSQAAVNAIIVEFNRAVNPQDTFKSDAPAPVLVQIFRGGMLGRCFGEVTVKDKLAVFVARNPDVFKEPGQYRVTVFAEQAGEGAPISAQDDGSALDGNFDGQPGVNFFLGFQVV